MSQFPIQTETGHPGEFILSEAAGQRSRENAFLADPASVKVGQPLKRTAAPNPPTQPLATYIPSVLGADCDALAIYAATSSSGNDLRIAVLVRDCEVNGLLINWGSMSTTEQNAGIARFATQGLIVRT